MRASSRVSVPAPFCFATSCQDREDRISAKSLEKMEIAAMWL
jgi:hypothetical protein